MTTTTAFIVLCGALFVNGAFLKRPHLDGRIIGGTDAEIEAYPYQLSLLTKGTDLKLCGATIISEDYALTSARCLYGAQFESIVFRAGSKHHDSGGSLHEAEEVTIHHEYYNGEKDYDYALVKVQPPFSFGPQVQAIGLNIMESEPEEEGTITGWGLEAAADGPFAEHLQVATVLISERSECKDATYRLLCVRAAEDGKDICLGDNGGPLVVRGKLAGIASNDGCGSSTHPSTFASVANQLEWIQTVAGI